MKADCREDEAQSSGRVVKIDVRDMPVVDVPGAAEVEQQILRHLLREQHGR
jgi:hypothetical protein